MLGVSAPRDDGVDHKQLPDALSISDEVHEPERTKKSEDMSVMLPVWANFLHEDMFRTSHLFGEL